MAPASDVKAAARSGLDLKSLRAETPGCRAVLHLDNAGAALMPRPVVEAQIAHLRLEEELGGYRAAEVARDKIAATYSALARLLGASREEIAVVENATVGWTLAFQSLDYQPGDRILTAEAEYASNYIAFLKLAEERGLSVEVVPSEESGQLSIAALEAMIDERVKLIAVTHVPTNGGLVNPAPEIGRLARAHGIPFLLDACQSAGQLELKVEELGCDFLSASGRKFLRGPRGSGFLYVRREILERLRPPAPDLHSASWEASDAFIWSPGAKRFENWEFNYAAVIGLGVAVDYALNLGLAAIEARASALAARLREGLAALPGVAVHDIGTRQCAIVTFTMEGRDPEAVKRALAEQNINVSTSTIRSTRLDMERRGLEAMVRASPHYYNSEEELDRFLDALKSL